MSVGPGCASMLNGDGPKFIGVLDCANAGIINGPKRMATHKAAVFDFMR